jgi:hypothetical protein
MSIRPFEREILDRYGSHGKAPDMITRRRGWKGVWIRGHLRDRRADYVYNMFLSWKAFCNQALLTEVKIKPGSYDAFRTYFYLLKRLGLVVFYAERRPQPGEPGSARRFYTLAPGLESDPGWERPFQSVYPETDWTRLSYSEKHERREKYKRLRHAEG